MLAQRIYGASRPIGGAIPAEMPPPVLSGKSDTQIAKTAAQHLLNAVKTAHDPQLKANLTQALATLHKFLAQDSKEQKQSLAPKVNAKAVTKANEAKVPKKK